MKKFEKLVKALLVLAFNVSMLMLTTFADPQEQGLITAYYVALDLLWMSFFFRQAIALYKGEDMVEIKEVMRSLIMDIFAAVVFSVGVGACIGRVLTDSLASAIVSTLFVGITAFAVWVLKERAERCGCSIYAIYAFAMPITTALLLMGESVGVSIVIALCVLTLIADRVPNKEPNRK